MSKQFLDKLIAREIANITTSSEIYRAASNREIHEFEITTNSIASEIRAELKHRNIAITPAVEEAIQEESIAIINDVVTFMKGKSFVGQRPTITTLENGVRILVYTPIADTIWRPTIEGGRRVLRKMEADIFYTISNSYKSSRARLVRKLNRILGFKTKEDKISGQFLALGHLDESAVIGKRIAESRESLSKSIQGYNQKGSEEFSQKEIDEIFGKDLFTLEQTSTNKKTIIKATIQSASLNSARGRAEEADMKAAYLSALKKAWLKLNNESSLAFSKGSDSRIDIERKKLIEAFTKPIIAKPNVRISKSNTKPKYSKSKSSAKVKRKRPTSTKVKHKVKTSYILPNIEQTEGGTSAINLNALKAQINAKLPAIVRKNMLPPGLVNRTGRFAASARVDSIIATEKGFPSIGYTYMKFPYQTFEPGFAKGDFDRDPRRVIDKSVREIANELLTGRFYTRSL